VIDYLSLDDVAWVHADRRQRLGLDPAPLHAPFSLWAERLATELQRSQAAAHYEQADLIRQAAFLAVGIAFLKPFVAGNYRIAYAAMETFLDLNRYII